MKTIKVKSFKEIPENYTGIVEFLSINKVEEYLKNGLLHRENGPAVIYDYPNETNRYYLNNLWIKNESMYWFLVLTFIKNKKKIPKIYIKDVFEYISF